MRLFCIHHSSFCLHPAVALRSLTLPTADHRNRGHSWRDLLSARRNPRDGGLFHPLSALFSGCGAAALCRCRVPKKLSQSRAGVPPAIRVPRLRILHHGPATRGGRRDACPTFWYRERCGKAGRRILFAGSQGPDGVVTSARAGGWAGSPAVLRRRAGVPARQSGQNNMALRILGQRGRTKKTHASKSMAPCSNGRSGCRQKSRS